MDWLIVYVRRYDNSRRFRSDPCEVGTRGTVVTHVLQPEEKSLVSRQKEREILHIHYFDPNPLQIPTYFVKKTLLYLNKQRKETIVRMYKTNKITNGIVHLNTIYHIWNLIKYAI